MPYARGILDATLEVDIGVRHKKGVAMTHQEFRALFIRCGGSAESEMPMPDVLRQWLDHDCDQCALEWFGYDKRGEARPADLMKAVPAPEVAAWKYFWNRLATALRPIP